MSLVTGTILIIIFGRSNGNKSEWTAHINRLKSINIIAVIMFILSVFKLIADWNGIIRTDLFEFIMPTMGIIMSLTYFFGFFGIAMASSVLDDVTGDISSNMSGKGASEPTDSVGRVIVVGGGCAGCTIALAMADKGHAVTLIERDLSQQDRIVGELLQPGGIRALERMGLSECAKENIGSIQVDGYVVIDPSLCDSAGRPKTQVLKYPESDPRTASEYFGILPQAEAGSGGAERPLGRSFHHSRFVQRLREKAISHPSVNVIEGTVSKLLEENGIITGVEYKVSLPEGGNEVKRLHSRLTLVADGIWSSQRKHLSPSEIQQASTFVGVVVQHPAMKSPVPHPQHGHVILCDPSPCLIYQISPTETRVLVDILGKMPSIADGSMQNYMVSKVAPQMPECFRQAFIEAVTPGGPRSSDIKSMPNKFFPASSPLKRGALLIGDALNMRHPLTGGGMTVALRDAETLAGLLADIDFTMGKAGSLQTTVDVNDSGVCALHDKILERYAVFLESRKCYASTINVLACALHSVFSTPGGDPTRQRLRQACFEYLNLGGLYAAGPIGLLSGLTPKPDVLTTHFFMVALYGVKRMCWDEPSWDSLVRVHTLIRVACTIILPLLRAEKSTILSNCVVQALATALFPPIETSSV